MLLFPWPPLVAYKYAPVCIDSLSHTPTPTWPFILIRHGTRWKHGASSFVVVFVQVLSHTAFLQLCRIPATRRIQCSIHLFNNATRAMPLDVFCDPFIWPYFKFISAAFSSSTNSAITNDDFHSITSEAVGLLQEMARAGSGGIPEVKLCIERHAARFTVCHSATVSSFFFSLDL